MDWETTSLERVVAATTKAVSEYIMVLCRGLRWYLRHGCQLLIVLKGNAKGDWRGSVHKRGEMHEKAKHRQFFLGISS